MNITFKKPRVSAYTFMKYLCADLAIKKNVIIDINQITQKIYDFKLIAPENSQYIFEDIEFRKSIDHVVSYDISEGLTNLQTFGIIGKLNPTYDKLIIYLTSSDANKILENADPITREVIDELSDLF